MQRKLFVQGLMFTMFLLMIFKYTLYIAIIQIRKQMFLIAQLFQPIQGIKFLTTCLEQIQVMYTEVLPTNSILPYSILSWKYVAFYLLSFALTYVAGNLLLHSEYFCPCLAEERIEQSRYLYKSLREGFSKEEKQLVNWLVKNQSREYISN